MSDQADESKRGPAGVPIDAYFARQMADPEFAREYEALQPEFDLIDQLVRLVAGEQSDDETLVDALTRIKAERDQLRLDEVALASVLFGDDHTAGKGFREMAARVRELQTFVWPSVAAETAQQAGVIAVCPVCGGDGIQDSGVRGKRTCVVCGGTGQGGSLTVKGAA